MKALLISVLMLFWVIPTDQKIRYITYRHKDVKTTFDVPDHFIGEYKGKKSGYLLMNRDGTGIYNYEIFGFAPSTCKKQPITVQWGLMLDENDQILKFEREYGYSYPILLKSTGATSFKGCREEVLLDFIMEYKDGTLGISSSDDWKK